MFVYSTMALRFIVRSLLTKRMKYLSSINRYRSKLPDKPVWIEINLKDLPEIPELTVDMIKHIERLSLVDFNNQQGIERLHSAISYANRLATVNTDGIEPMYSVLEDSELMLHEDSITEGGCRSNILQNASIVDEDYFVAPPGNIPLKQNNKNFNTGESVS
ncbi:hypothetical protein ACF0H5_014588 [Mactra antiquata]